jgi:hypothetical protein
MELKIEGSEKDINKFLKMNSLFMKRNSIKIVLEEEDVKEIKLTANQVVELISKVEDLDESKEPRKRRTKAEIEADKLKELE